MKQFDYNEYLKNNELLKEAKTSQIWYDRGGRDLLILAQKLVDSGYDKKDIIDAIKEEVHQTRVYGTGKVFGKYAD